MAVLVHGRLVAGARTAAAAAAPWGGRSESQAASSLTRALLFFLCFFFSIGGCRGCFLLPHGHLQAGPTRQKSD